MRIRGNYHSLVAWRALTSNTGGVSKSLERLSSGLRVNSAADDAAGLSIASKLRGQFRGLVQANRNALDGISLVGTAEGALQQVHSLLQRALELSLAANNDVYDVLEREMLQLELDQILREINRVADSARFNGVSLLNPGGNSTAKAAIIDGLHNGWLDEPAKLIAQFFGIKGDGVDLTIILQDSGATPTWIEGTVDGWGKLDDLKLYINVDDFGPIGGPDGGPGPVHNDRKVAKALTEAVLARNSNFGSLSSWFVTGAGEYIAGRDEQLASDIQRHGLDAVVAVAISGSGELHRSGAYLAMKYLDHWLQTEAGYTVQDVMMEISWGNDLDSAIGNLTGMREDTFMMEFAANAQSFLTNNIDLTDDDVGGLNPGDARGVIPDGAYNPFPLAPDFRVRIADAIGGGSKPSVFALQVGANEGEQIFVEIPEISTATLGLIGFDLVRRPQQPTERILHAIDFISSVRANLGAIHNRLEHVMAQNGVRAENELSSYSKIMDADFAKETTHLVRRQILTQSSAAMLAQANAMHQSIAWLLREV